MAVLGTPSSSTLIEFFSRQQILCHAVLALYTTPYVPSPILQSFLSAESCWRGIFDVGASEPGLGALGSSAIVFSLGRSFKYGLVGGAWGM